MAEGLLRKLASRAWIQVEVRSAGVAATSGMPISRHAEAVLKIIALRLYARSHYS